MRNLSKHVIPLVAAKWYELGLELLETKHEAELDVIETNSKDDAIKCCRKMFSKWLQLQSHRATWNRLIQAIKNIQLNSVASKVEELLLQGKVIIGVIR